MAKAIGIDLGTTNSVIATIGAGGSPHVLRNKENEDLTNSAVGPYKGQFLVGSRALDRLQAAPRDTIISVKRLMGRAFRDPEVQKAKKRYAYEIVAPFNASEEDVRVVLDGKEYSPVEISAMILKKLKEDAKLRIKDEVEFAVITVPAYFTEKQIDATRRAGQQAGLKVQRVLDEPTAAAIAFGVDNIGPDECRTVLVYDLGGGTFDVSIMTIVGGVFAQLAIRGDMWLGGDDFDHLIMDHVIERLEADYDVRPRDNAQFMVKLKEEAEKAKQMLSNLDVAEIVLPGGKSDLKDQDGNLIDVDTELKIGDFESMIRGRVLGSIELVKAAMQDARITAEQIDNILLVGGCSSIPLVRRELAALFGDNKLRMDLDPMRCVAFGAAVLAARLGETILCSKGHANPGFADACVVCGERFIELARVSAHDYGIETQGGEFSVLIPVGSAYPVTKTRGFLTPSPGLGRLRVPVYAGRKHVARDNDLQLTAWLEIPEDVAADVPVEVTISLDKDCAFEKIKVKLLDGSSRAVEVFSARGGDRRSLLENKLYSLRNALDKNYDASNRSLENLYSEAIQAANENRDEELERNIEDLEKLLSKDQSDETSAADWIERAEGLISYADFVLERFGWSIEPPQRGRIRRLAGELSEAVYEKNATKGSSKLQELGKETDRLPPVILDLMAVINGSIRAERMKMLIEADRLRIGEAEIEKALRNGNYAAANAQMSELVSILDRVFSERITQSAKIVEDVLKSA